MNKHKIVIILYFVAISLLFINPVFGDSYSGDFVYVDFSGTNQTINKGSYISSSSYNDKDFSGVISYSNVGINNDINDDMDTQVSMSINYDVDLDVESDYAVHMNRISGDDLQGLHSISIPRLYYTDGSYVEATNINKIIDAPYELYFGCNFNTTENKQINYIALYTGITGNLIMNTNVYNGSVYEVSTIDFNPDYTITNSSYYPSEDYSIGSDDVPANPDHRVYYVKLYSYKWINETWDSKTLYQWNIQGQGMQTKVNINYNVNPSGNINRGTFVHYGIGDYYKIQTELVNPFIGVIATDSFIYDNRVNPPPPPPTPEPTPEPTPSNTPTPEPTPTPQPTPEPINETLNTDFIQGYYNIVNESVDGTFEPVYNFTYFIAYPLVSLNESLSNFTIQMNESFNTTSYSIGISTNIFFIIMSSFPQKIINVFTYYLIWVIIQLIFKGDT